MNEELKKRIKELAGEVRYHSELYHGQSKQELTDAEYDAMVDELKALTEEMRSADPEDEAVSDGEQALGMVGAVPSYGKKVKHSQMMGSLDKETTYDGIRKWARNYSPSESVVVTPKIDGMSLRINYEDGKLVGAATRGDGTVGQDVTDNVREMASVPKTIPCKTCVEVRGEVYMRRSVFEKMKESGERSFANPRNAASGSVMAKDPKVTGKRKLDFFVHGVIPGEGTVFSTEQEKRAWMASNLVGFELVPMETVELNKFDGAAVAWESKRPSLDYQIDGLVCSLQSISEQEEAGWNGKRPRGKMAYKFRPEQKTAKVVSIDWQVGRTGKLCPMARIEPTLVDGSTISNITLHNAARVGELDVATGDEVLIEKAGDIIPQVVRVTSRTGRKVVHSASKEASVYPSKCPVCGGDVERDGNDVNLWCRNPVCQGKLEGRVLHYIKTLDILGVGEGIVAGLCTAGYVKDVPDLYYLTMEQVKEVTGGERAAEKVMTAILEKNQVPLAVFLDSLGIDGLGTTTSKDVAKEYKSLQGVLENVNASALTGIEGIGGLTAKKIVEGLQAMAPMVERLRQAIDVLEVKEAKGKLTGMSFVLTGAMSKPRKDIEKAIEAAGGEMKSSVSKGVTYLVQADASSTSSKSEKAKKLGTKVIGEDELWRMME